MRQVETCDFCGDGASGLYEPLPASMPDSPRFALCDGCRDRLASVVDPLLARLEDEATRTMTEPGPGTAADEGPAREPPRGGPDPRAPDGSGTVAEPTADASEPAPVDPSVSESRDASGRSKEERRGTPPGYRKVMRFLENRKLPIDRSEAELLASEAYDLEGDVVAEAIDHAVQYGRLRQVDGELKR